MCDLDLVSYEEGFLVENLDTSLVILFTSFIICYFVAASSLNTINGADLMQWLLISDTEVVRDGHYIGWTADNWHKS